MSTARRGEAERRSRDRQARQWLDPSPGFRVKGATTRRSPVQSRHENGGTRTWPSSYIYRRDDTTTSVSARYGPRLLGRLPRRLCGYYGWVSSRYHQGSHSDARPQKPKVQGNVALFSHSHCAPLGSRSVPGHVPAHGRCRGGQRHRLRRLRPDPEAAQRRRRPRRRRRRRAPQARSKQPRRLLPGRGLGRHSPGARLHPHRARQDPSAAPGRRPSGRDVPRAHPVPAPDPPCARHPRRVPRPRHHPAPRGAQLRRLLRHVRGADEVGRAGADAARPAGRRPGRHRVLARLLSPRRRQVPAAGRLVQVQRRPRLLPPVGARRGLLLPLSRPQLHDRAGLPDQRRDLRRSGLDAEAAGRRARARATGPASRLEDGGGGGGFGRRAAARVEPSGSGGAARVVGVGRGGRRLLLAAAAGDLCSGRSGGGAEDGRCISRQAASSLRRVALFRLDAGSASLLRVLYIFMWKRIG